MSLLSTIDCFHRSGKCYAIPTAGSSRTCNWVAIDQVRQVDNSGLARIAGGYGGFVPVQPAMASSGGLIRALRGHLPERVEERHVQATFDTAENRFVKSFLQSADGVIDKMRSIAASAVSSDAFRRKITLECDHLTGLLRPVIGNPIWRDVGPMVHLPASSTVLQMRRGYRDVYRHFAKMRLAARVPLRADLVRDLLEAKDIAQLYEVWCFFALVRELTVLLGTPKRADGMRVDPLQVTVPWELECAWSDGTRVLYNPRFSRSRARQHSFSVPLRPDIAVEITDGPNSGFHLFDAKFKVDHLSTFMPLDDGGTGLDSGETEERQGTFKRGDLYKMHAYRDAIPDARSVWILYPGTDVRYFSEHLAPVTISDSLPMVPNGVGAIPALPGDGQLSALRTVLLRLTSMEDRTSAR